MPWLTNHCGQRKSVPCWPGKGQLYPQRESRQSTLPEPWGLSLGFNRGKQGVVKRDKTKSRKPNKAGVHYWYFPAQAFYDSLTTSVAQSVKNLPTIQKTWVWSLGWNDPWVEKVMATHSSILAWRTPWTEEPSGLQSMGSQRVGHDWVTSTFTSTTGTLSSSTRKVGRSVKFWENLKSGGVVKLKREKKVFLKIQK